MTLRTEADIKDLGELIRDAQSGKFNTRTTELLTRALIYHRDALITQHRHDTELLDLIRTVCAREFGLPKEHPFFLSTYNEDFAPIGFSHDEALLEMFRQEALQQEGVLRDEEIILILCHG